jgi:hypothetical protein
LSISYNGFDCTIPALSIYSARLSTVIVYCNTAKKSNLY